MSTRPVRSGYVRAQTQRARGSENCTFGETRRVAKDEGRVCGEAGDFGRITLQLYGTVSANPELSEKAHRTGAMHPVRPG
jgi:hypothetical protein